MKYAECAESKQISYFRFFRFLFFELWSFLYSKYGKYEFSPITRKTKIGKLISSFRKFHKNLTTSEGGGVSAYPYETGP